MHSYSRKTIPRRTSFRMALTVLLVCAVVLTLPCPGYCGDCPGCGAIDPLCGPKCLKEICERLGDDISLEDLAKLAGYDRRTGTNMAGLQSAAKARGLEAIGVKISADELVELGLPAISYLWNNHFAIIERQDDTGFLVVIDPPDKRRPISREDLGDIYSGFALLLATEKGRLPDLKSKGPDFRISEYMLDMGAVEEGSLVEKALVCRNAGNENLEIATIEASTEYLRGFASQETIPPGGEAEIIAVVDATHLAGSRRATLRVHSNDPVSPVVQLQVEVEVEPTRLVYSPHVADFGTVRQKEPATRKIYVRKSRVREIQVLNVSSDNPFVTASVSEADDRGGYVVSLSVSPEAPLGKLSGSLAIHTNHPKDPKVDIPLTGMLKGDLEVAPDLLYFGLLDVGSEAHRSIQISSASGKPFRVDAVDNPLACMVVTLAPAARGNGCTLTAVLRRGAPLGYIRGAVVLHTDNPEQRQIRIPVYGLVEERHVTLQKGG